MTRFPTFAHLLAYRDQQVEELHSGRIGRKVFRDRIYRASRQYKREHPVLDPTAEDRRCNRELCAWLTRHESEWLGRSDPTPEAVAVRRELVARWVRQTGCTGQQLLDKIKDILQRRMHEQAESN